MAKYLESGTRRDVCALLYDAGDDGLRAQQLKTRLERHYDRSIDPKRFRDRLAALERAGHVETRVEGLHDVCTLTDAGGQALLEHYEWLAGRMEGAPGNGEEGEDGNTRASNGD